MSISIVQWASVIIDKTGHVLRFVGLTHCGVEILLTTFRTDCADLHQKSNKSQHIGYQATKTWYVITPF